MPYKSEAQRRFFNSPAGKEKIGKENVEEWNKESKGRKNIPEKVFAKDSLKNAIKLCDGVVKYTSKIEMYEDKRKAKYAVVSFDGTILADGFESKEKAKEWANKNKVDLKG